MTSKKTTMAWNEPEDKGSPDPWGKKNGIPELESWLKKIQDKLSSGDEGGTQPPSVANSAIWAIVIAVFFLLIYLFAGFYIVDPQEEGVVLLFGKYQQTVGPGPHWVARMIQSESVVNVQEIQDYSYQANMLTKDENIVDVAVAVQFRIAKPEDYLFNVNSPTISLQQATASALRQVIGNTNLDDILTSGREQVSEEVRVQIVQILEKYKTGIEITQVALQPAKAPDAVKDAFDDAIKAQEDEQRYVNQAQAYRMQVIPQANGEQQRILSNANAYKQQVVLNARGETARYLALLPEYQLNPEITRERLYIGALQNVFTNSTKVFIDQRQGNSTLMYLPLDNILAKANRALVKVTENINESASPSNTNASLTPSSDATSAANGQAGDNFSGYGKSPANPYSFLNEGNQ